MCISTPALRGGLLSCVHVNVRAFRSRELVEFVHREVGKLCEEELIESDFQPVLSFRASS